MKKSTSAIALCALLMHVGALWGAENTNPKDLLNYLERVIARALQEELEMVAETSDLDSPEAIENIALHLRKPFSSLGSGGKILSVVDRLIALRHLSLAEQNLEETRRANAEASASIKNNDAVLRDMAAKIPTPLHNDPRLSLPEPPE